MAARYEANDDDNFSQPRVFYQVNNKNKKNLFLIIIIILDFRKH
jgi:catalase